MLSQPELAQLVAFFSQLGAVLHRALVPGGHVLIASNPLLSTLTFHALHSAGLEKRGEVVRLVQTLRGGDRPKGAEAEFADVSVMARSGWEPWGVFRKPLDGTVAARPIASANLVRQLQMLGAPDAQGRRSFSIANTF